MRFLRYLAVLAILIIPAATYSHAQVSVGVDIGGPVYGGYEYAPPVCSYGYYDYAPYACAPYGYYGPNWFVGGLFIGAGPWFRHGYGGYGYGYRGGYYGRTGYGYRGGEGYRGGYGYRGGEGYRGGYGYHGGEGYRGGGQAYRGGGGGDFHGGGGGGGFRGGGGGHGGGHR